MNDFEKFYNKALRFLSFRLRSEKEITDFLKRKKSPEEIIKRVILKLKEKNFVNDKEFTKLWIEQRIEFKPRSLKLIEMELKQKGVAEEVIEYQISNITGIAGQISNIDLAKKLVEKKMKSLKGSKEEILPKLQRFLISKGFNWDIIKEVLKGRLELSRS